MRVFLSYSGARELAERVAEKLQAFVPGLRVWHSGEIRGKRWDKQIRENLLASKALIVLCTPQVTKSVYVGFEIGFVDRTEAHSNIYVLRAGLTNEQLAIKPPLGFFQAYDLKSADEFQEFLQKLCIDMEADSSVADARSTVEVAVARFIPLIDAACQPEMQPADVGARLKVEQFISQDERKRPPTPPEDSDLRGYRRFKPLAEDTRAHFEFEKLLAEFKEGRAQFHENMLGGNHTKAYQSCEHCKSRVESMEKIVGTTSQRSKLNDAVKQCDEMTEQLEASARLDV